MSYQVILAEEAEQNIEAASMQMAQASELAPSKRILFLVIDAIPVRCEATAKRSRLLYYASILFNDAHRSCVVAIDQNA